MQIVLNEGPMNENLDTHDCTGGDTIPALYMNFPFRKFSVYMMCRRF